MVFQFLKSAFGSTASASDRRSHYRLEDKRASVVIKNRTFSVLDWSPEGFRLSGYAGVISEGEKLRVRLMVPHRDISYGFDLNCEIRHVDPRNGALGAALLDVDPATGQRLKRIFADKLR